MTPQIALAGRVRDLWERPDLSKPCDEAPVGAFSARHGVHRGHQFVERDKVEHPPDVVGKRGQAELCPNLLQPASIDLATQTVAPLVLTVPLVRRRSGRDTRLLVDGPEATRVDPGLLRMLVRARALKAKLLQSGEASLDETSRSEGISRSYLTRLARLAFLAPEIVCAILDGRQPVQLTAARLSRITYLPLDWSEQSRMLGSD